MAKKSFERLKNNEITYEAVRRLKKKKRKLQEKYGINQNTIGKYLLRPALLEGMIHCKCSDPEEMKTWLETFI